VAEIKCNKCSAPIQFEAGDKFVKCSHCDTLIFIDKSGAGFYYIIPFLIGQDDAMGTFKRWAAGSKVVKDLDRLAQVVSLKQQYFPVYLFRRDVNGSEKVSVEPAKSTTLPGLHNLKVPAGNLKIFDQSFNTGGVELLKPDMDMMAYLPNLPGAAKEQALVYFPLWLLKYSFEGKQYDLIIDGSSGELFVADFPARKGAPYLIIAAGAFGVFLVEGLLGLVISMFTPLGWVCAFPLALVTIPIVFIGAYNVVRRY
jgi:LSD1 subclass zinc finger protein